MILKCHFALEFPAGVLQGELFAHDRPHYINYGAIGQIIGHEVTHGFDDLGRQFDAKGNLFDWWDKTTETEFIKKKECIVNQYLKFVEPDVFYQVKIRKKITQST